MTDHAMIEIRRNTRLATVIATGAGAVALAFLIRGGAVSAAVGAAFLALALAAGWTLIDGRTPLMVVDEQGVRMRLGRDWRGMPWARIDEIEHMPRPAGAAGMWRDGRLAILPTDESSEVMALSDSGARQAAWTQRLFGVPFAVPLGMTTTVVGNGKPLTIALAELAGTTTRVVEIDPSAEDVEDHHVPMVEDTGAFTAVGPSWSVEPTTDRVGPISFESPLVAARSHEAGSPSPEPPVALTAVPAMRDTARPMRVEATFEPIVSGANALAVDFEPHTVIEIVELDVEPEPAIVPVIGPRIAAARSHVGLSVEDLAERTRIRAHVIEAIEVDDFAACGGDFYARGHLRTLARTLGLDADALLETYGELYGSAPIDPREVFAAEFGHDTPTKPLAGGPQWSVLIASAMGVVLLWSVVRLFTAGAAPEAVPGISLEGNVTSPYAKIAPPVPVVINAVGSGAHVVITDASGNIVFSGDLAFGGTKTIQAVPPLKVQSSDGSVTVGLSGGQPTPVGTSGAPALRTYSGN
ncbi:hypothetical protein Back2_01230 [Nocardioides baekrokdamisoli]|uniref:HTH cro/C1-type domain-containing protein n=1 Tax=Nocardioides baekrokdamisoli TaxID=1804624 RepID=A0A3G9IC14_9ACTN|nr:helix-turn-helix domain-containing protein [Nocardioides baekrokdamisoli]BBH15836.1 hypothetical protein Back2_01230 [Nocardioides baekrokdamisoli]